MKKIFALLSLLSLFLLFSFLYFYKPPKTGEAVKTIETDAEKPNYSKKDWYLIGEISIENGKVIGVKYFKDVK